MEKNISKYNGRRYFPMLVSDLGTEKNMSSETVMKLWGIFDGLSKIKQDVLTAMEMPEKIGAFQEKIGLSDVGIGNVSLVIRKIFFEELPLSQAETSLKNALVASGDDSTKARTIVEFIEKEIMTIVPKPESEEVIQAVEFKPVSTAVRMPLLQAMSKYENLGNQPITRERIKFRSQSETVRPSLLSWIKYYRDELGVGHHSSVERGNFLFRSENGKRLSNEERERLNLVLKSVEENFPIEIDTEQSSIIFPPLTGSVPRPTTPTFSPEAERHDQRAQAPGPRAQSFTPPTSKPVFQFGKQASVETEPPVRAFQTASTPGSGMLSFSSNHVLPAEKETQPQPQSRPVQGQSIGVGEKPKSSPFHIRPVSMGKDEE